MKYTSLQIHAFSFKTVQKQKSKTFHSSLRQKLQLGKVTFLARQRYLRGVFVRLYHDLMEYSKLVRQKQLRNALLL